MSVVLRNHGGGRQRETPTNISQVRKLSPQEDQGTANDRVERLPQPSANQPKQCTPESRDWSAGEKCDSCLKVGLRKRVSLLVLLAIVANL